jgi:hypothetical protein
MGVPRLNSFVLQLLFGFSALFLQLVQIQGSENVPSW